MGPWLCGGGTRRRPIPGAVIHPPTDETSIDPETGAVTSRQGADIVLPAAALAGLWDPEHLERAARTYWSTLRRFTLGLMHVDYTETERSVVLLSRRLPLLTFQAPEYEMDRCRGIVRWRIDRGLLVSSRGREGDGYLELDFERHDEGRAGPPPRRGRGRQLLPAADRPLAPRLRQHPVAHPRPRLQLLPPPPRPPRTRDLQGRPLRRPPLRRADAGPGAGPRAGLARLADQLPNQRARRLEPKCSFFATCSAEGALKVPVREGPERKSMSTLPTRPLPNSM